MRSRVRPCHGLYSSDNRLCVRVLLTNNLLIYFVVGCLHEATFSVASSRRERARRRVAKTGTRKTCALPARVWSSSHALRAPAQSRVHTLALRRSSQKELFFLTAFILETRIFPPTVRLNIHKKPSRYYRHPYRQRWNRLCA